MAKGAPPMMGPRKSSKNPRAYFLLAGGATTCDNCVWEIPVVQAPPTIGALAQPIPLVTAEKCHKPDM